MIITIHATINDINRQKLFDIYRYLYIWYVIITGDFDMDKMLCKPKDPKQNLLFCVIKSSLSGRFPYFSVFDI